MIPNLIVTLSGEFACHFRGAREADFAGSPLMQVAFRRQDTLGDKMPDTGCNKFLIGIGVAACETVARLQDYHCDLEKMMVSQTVNDCFVYGFI